MKKVKSGSTEKRSERMHGRNRDTDVEDKRMDTKRGRRGWDELGDWD